MKSLLACCGCLLLLSVSSAPSAPPLRLAPAPSPADNPLKGLVPYANPKLGNFPHSMEFTYLRLSDLMRGPAEFNWKPLEEFLNSVASRGHQAVFRVWLEYPGQQTGVPQYLLDQGLKLTRWSDPRGRPWEQNQTPDYADPRLVSAIETFIAELGRRYDHDPRIGFITAGLLGEWGEWHDAPRKELFASMATQLRVMQAYEKALTQIPILLRYPAGEKDRSYAANARRPFGYHDDSFAWATVPTGKRSDRWFFLSRMNAAGTVAVDKWKTHPIGGEIRPEIWGQVFDKQPANPRAQNFAECVQQSHVTWLMDSGMVKEPVGGNRYTRAVAEVRRMGYDFCVQTADVSRPSSGKLSVALQVINQGVAPFYRDWTLEVGLLSGEGRVLRKWPVDWKLIGLLPSDSPRRWQATVEFETLPAEGRIVAIRAINPLANGKPLCFANADQDRHVRGWLSIGKVTPSDSK